MYNRSIFDKTHYKHKQILSFFSYSYMRRTFLSNVVLNSEHLIDICGEVKTYVYSERFVRLLLFTSKKLTPDELSLCLCSAVKNNNIEIVKLLIEDGRVDLSSNEMYSMRLAIELNHNIILGLMIENYFPEKKSFNHSTIVKLLLECDDCSTLNTLLHNSKITEYDILHNKDIIIYNESYKCLELAIKIINNTNMESEYVTQYHNSLMILVSTVGNSRMARRILKEIKPKDRDLESSLREATKNGHYMVVDILLPLMKSNEQIISCFDAIHNISRQPWKNPGGRIMKLRSQLEIDNDYYKTAKLYVEDGRVDMFVSSNYILNKILYYSIGKVCKLFEFLLPKCNLEKNNWELFFSIIWYLEDKCEKYSHVLTLLLSHSSLNSTNIINTILPKLEEYCRDHRDLHHIKEQLLKLVTHF